MFVILDFENLILFRISDFVLRIFDGLKAQFHLTCLSVFKHEIVLEDNKTWLWVSLHRRPRFL